MIVLQVIIVDMDPELLIRTLVFNALTTISF